MTAAGSVRRERASANAVPSSEARAAADGVSLGIVAVRRFGGYI